MTIDFRSDTVTLPSPGMRKAMFSAPLGDDVFGEDPTVNALEKMAAEMFGMEASIFCPSGTMTNQIAIRLHAFPGSEVIVEETAHTYLYEGGGIAMHSGSSVALLPGDRGRFTASQVREAINNPADTHRPLTSMVSIENTCNKGGGACWELEEIQQIRKVCDEHKLALHLDGARLMNALVAKGQSPADFGKEFHTISLCLSKGLGAPVGSLLLGNSELIHRARRIRKAFGGGMRQAGILAAAGIYALDHQVERLVEDHGHARRIAERLQNISWVESVLPVETNIVIFSPTDSFTVTQVIEDLKLKGILAVPFGKNQIRLVTHLDIDQAMIEEAIKIIVTLY